MLSVVHSQSLTKKLVTFLSQIVFIRLVFLKYIELYCLSSQILMIVCGVNGNQKLSFKLLLVWLLRNASIM
jgi:hypothetical protein